MNNNAQSQQGVKMPGKWNVFSSHLCRTASLVATIFLGGQASLAAAQPIPVKCQSFQDPPPAWVFSGDFINGGASIVLVDSLHGTASSYSLEGKRLRDFSLRSSSQQVEKPSWIRMVSRDSYLIEDEDGRIVQLDAQLNPKGVLVDFLEVTNPEGQTIGSIWGWQISASRSHALVVGDVKDRAGNWSSGYVLIPVKSPKNFKIVHPIKLNGLTRTLSRLGNTYSASLGENFYFVSMEDDIPAIYRLALPSGLKTKVVNLPDKRYSSPPNREVPSLFGALEQASIPVGVYSWRDSIFVLSRSPLGQGRTQWSLAKLDVNGAQLEDPRPLQVDANHAVVIAGSDSWALIQKGSVRGVGQQKVAAICTFSPADL